VLFPVGANGVPRLNQCFNKKIQILMEKIMLLFYETQNTRLILTTYLVPKSDACIDLTLIT
jgi:hypothetical protein